jgi:transcriptional regulator with XRE-family HTH domain
VGIELDQAIEDARARRQLPSPRARRAIRVGAGIPQRVIAQELGVSRVQVSRYEAGSRDPAPSIARRYSEVLSRLRSESIGQDGEP